MDEAGLPAGLEEDPWFLLDLLELLGFDEPEPESFLSEGGTFPDTTSSTVFESLAASLAPFYMPFLTSLKRENLLPPIFFSSSLSMALDAFFLSSSGFGAPG